VLEKYAGRYKPGAADRHVPITREGIACTAQLTGQARFRLYPESESKFFWQSDRRPDDFEMDADGEVVRWCCTRVAGFDCGSEVGPESKARDAFLK